MRWIVGGKAIERQAASTSQMGRFETELLATARTEALVDMNGVWIDKVHDRHPPKMIILDMDSSVSDPWRTRGNSVQWSLRLYLLASAIPVQPVRRLKRCSLRPGNVHSADGWRNVLEPVVMRYKERKVRLIFVAMPPSPDRRYTNISKPRDYSTSSASKRTRSPAEHCPSAYATVGRPPDHVRRFHASFSYQPDRGTRSAVSWPKWSGTPASWFLASD